MVHRASRFLVLALLGTALTAGEAGPAPQPIAFAQGLAPAGQDRTVLERYIGHAAAYAQGLTAEKVARQCAESPETFAWLEFPHLDCLLDAYELTGDTAHLDLFSRCFALFRAIMEPGDDGHLGWHGRPIPPRRPADRPDLRIDELQMSFRAIAILARWVVLARADAAYARAHADEIAAHLELMERHLFPKWDARGFFADLGADGGVYRGLDYPLCNRDAPGVTLSFEKTAIIVEGLLRLHQAAPQDAYLRRAIQLGTRFKRCLSLKDGCYAWMSWDPAGRWDADPGKEDAWRIGWIAPDPKGEWYAASASIAVRLHRLGLVFDATDLERFIATQKARCWNGDLEKPQYATVAGAAVGSSKHITGRFLSFELAVHDPVLERLAFAGPHEAEVLAGSSNPWKGCVGIAGYVRGKFLVRPRLAAGALPVPPAVSAFLAAEGNRAFLDRLRCTVTAPGRISPLKPSQMAP